jgi:hypothetical protein
MGVVPEKQLWGMALEMGKELWRGIRQVIKVTDIKADG